LQALTQLCWTGCWGCDRPGAGDAHPL